MIFIIITVFAKDKGSYFLDMLNSKQNAVSITVKIQYNINAKIIYNPLESNIDSIIYLKKSSSVDRKTVAIVNSAR
jgi:hypothetical protein